MYTGYIERHSNEDGLRGWCVHGDEALRTVDGAVSIDLYAGDVLLRTISTFLDRSDIQKTHGVRKAGFLLPLSADLVDLIPEGTALRLVADDGVELALATGKSVVPLGRATDGGEQLRAAMAAGHMVDKWGCLKLPFSAKPHLRESYMDALQGVTALFNERFGLMVVPAYGTLLGMARGGRFIDHDDDVDLAVLLPYHGMHSLATRIQEIVRALIEDGHAVSVVSIGQFHLTLKDSTLPDIDMFIAWQESDHSFYTHFGVGGALDRRVAFCTRELEGRSVTVPDCYEDILALAYGPSWREPDPGFQWSVSEDVGKKMRELEAAGSVAAAEFTDKVA